MKGRVEMNFLSCCKLESSHSFKENNSFKESVADTNKAFNRNGNRFSFFIKSMSHRTGSSRHRRISEEVMKVGNAKVSARIFSYQELAAATNNFNDDCLVGEGGFGKVYKGRVQSTDQDVAIKQLDKNGRQGNREFFSEVLMLNLVQHTNLVKLIGYCLEDEHRLLVYEFLINGSLEDHLLDLPPGKEPLDWNTRMKIAVGAAKGLEYLHDVAKPSIIYRDFKASNILLDADFNPKLSDFGLAKLAPSGEQELVSTRVMGTFGYCAPEYQRACQLTAKSDVYGFGVVFLELITGRRVIDMKRPTEEQNLIYWAEPLFKDKSQFTQMADPLLQDNYPKKGLYQALAIAATCLQEEPDTRPFMSDVVSALQFLAKPKAEDQVDRISFKCCTRYVDSVIEGKVSDNQGV